MFIFVCSIHADHFKFIRTIGAGSAVLLKNTDDTPSEHAEDEILNPEEPNNCQNGTLTIDAWKAPSVIQMFMHMNNPTTAAKGHLDDFKFGVVDLLTAEVDTCLVFTNADSDEGVSYCAVNIGLKFPNLISRLQSHMS
ncbi:hypothetical protein M422DRAFT_272291 [Sphaerobolus stellatus SS14]|uniref:Uncharacterized protein n=1 Tax=Sphaerobolus stellatus (strain SS14) TaxID=990650 RepID=A0A0C9UM72_SPHS4|nr:hypothetical protein M422DRAFT_272291 [Sphaerobolus stellatus SS14]